MHLSCRCLPLVEDQALHIVGEVDEGDLGFGTFDADGSNEQPHVRFLLREDMLDEDAHLRFGAIGLARVVGHRLALGLLAVDAADPAIGFEPRFIAL